MRKVINAQQVSSVWPLWEKLSFAGLLVASGFLYLWNLSINGWANQFYSASVLAGTKSWEGFLFGSNDIGNSITVDKPPAFLWLMDISVKLFGFNSWAILVPQALLGVGTIAVLYFIVRQFFPAAVALVAGVLMASTPVGSVIFRYNNPDALLTFLITLAALFVLLGIKRGGIKWIIFAGICFGFAFLTKEFAAFLSLPGLGLVYVVLAPGSIGKRVRELGLGLLAICVSAGWWVALMVLTPSSNRPYAAGSSNNSFLSAVFGYNGFNRLAAATAKVPAALKNLPGAGEITDPGSSFRLFVEDVALEGGWLLPITIVMLFVTIFYYLHKKEATKGQKGTVALLALWLIPTSIIFSLMSGIFHSYYVVVTAPTEAGITAIGLYALWRLRQTAHIKTMISFGLVLNALWFIHLITTTSLPVNLFITLTLGLNILAIFFVILSHRSNRTAVIAACLVVLTLVAVPAYYSVLTTAAPRTGASPEAGPFPVAVPVNTITGENSTQKDFAEFLNRGAKGYRWVAVAYLAKTANYYQVLSGDSVMPIGGYTGDDNSPTFSQFKSYVSQHDIHYFISPSVSEVQNKDGKLILQWVQNNFMSQTIDHVKVYNLQP